MGRMIGLLLIEISAFHGFRWAEAVLGDTELVAGDGQPAAWSPTSAPTRPPTWPGCAPPCRRCATGPGWASRAAGPTRTDMIGRLWDRPLSDSIAPPATSRQPQLRHGEIERHSDGRPDRHDVIDEMLSLGSVTAAETARWPTHRNPGPRLRTWALFHRSPDDPVPAALRTAPRQRIRNRR